MALPKLNNLPKYELTIPSTGKKVKYRPYLVQEEKVIMMAMETGDNKSALQAVVDTIDACVTGGVKKTTLTTFDVEYMFTQIRSKSSGETSKVVVKCSECESGNEVDVEIDKIKIDVPKGKTVHKLNEDVSIELGFPSYESIADYDGATDMAAALKMAASCVVAITFDEERTLAEDCTEAELTEFLESMTTDQFKLLSDFMATIPKLSHEVKFVCKDCGHKNAIVVEGMQNFL